MKEIVEQEPKHLKVVVVQHSKMQCFVQHTSDSSLESPFLFKLKKFNLKTKKYK
jgi:hypothetical protein